MRIEFNALGAVSDIITNDEPLRQGNVGANTLTAVFEGKSNLAYTATFNYTRSDDGRLKDIPLTPTANAGEYYYKFSNPWFFALYGETTLTVYLKNSANEIVASGQITFPIEQTDFDDDPNITYSEYELLLDAITAKQDKFEVYNVRGYNSFALAEADAGLVDGQIIIVRGTPTEIYQVQAGELVDLIVNKATRDSLGNVIKDSYVSAVYPTYNTTTDKLFIETYSVEDALLANNEVILPKATTTKNGLMAKEDKVKVDDLPTTYETIANSDAKIKNLGIFTTELEAVIFAPHGQMSMATLQIDYVIPIYIVKNSQYAIAIKGSQIREYRNIGYPNTINWATYAQLYYPTLDYVGNNFQSKLTFDTTPTAASTNPVTSGGIKTYADTKQSTSEKGQPSGYASLDSGGKVPSTQLPSYVDDVLEFANLASFPATGSASVIYVALDTNLTYRWSGSAYVEISPSLALGETSSTAYRGDRGKIAYDHSQSTSGNPHNVTKADVGLTTTDVGTYKNLEIDTAEVQVQSAIEDKNGNDITTTYALQSDVVNSMISITHANLKTLRDSSQLIKGQQYRITDFVTTTAQTNTQSAGHAFDLIVVADDVNILNENARACLHSGDTYFANSKLEAWKIKYCLDNDTTRFAWADTINGKGVIYRLIDEFENDVPYDFKNIQFLRTSFVDTDYSITFTNKYFYTFSAYRFDASTGIQGDIEEASVIAKQEQIDDLYNVCCNNRMLPLYAYEYSEVLGSPDWKLNNNVFINRYASMDTYFDCSFNTFGNDCYSNTFGTNCFSNTFGNDCSSNTFGTNCYSNTFGTNCFSNTFGNYCYSNTFGNYCYSNTIVVSGSYPNYARYIIFENGSAYIDLQASDATGILQNIHISMGVVGASTQNMKVITEVRGLTHDVVYRATGSEDKVA